MNARGDVLTVGDIVKIFMRKFLRLAPAYYSMWMLVWAFSSRLSKGPMWHNVDKNTRNCSDYWLSTLFMVGNIYP